MMREYVVDRTEAGRKIQSEHFQAVNDSLAKMEGKGIARRRGWNVIEIWDMESDTLVGKYVWDTLRERWGKE